MKCVRCNKNTAVVFITKIENGKQLREGLCIPCAKKEGLNDFESLLKSYNMTDDDFNNINSQMEEMFKDVDFDEVSDNEEGGMGASFSKLFNSAFAGNNEKYDENKGDEKTVKKGVKKPRKRKNLDKYGINLNKRAMEGKVDKIIGREREIDRVIQILNRRNKNNPVLIGEPGVGKTAIAEGLAMRIVEEKVPTKLLTAELYLLDLTALVAGTQFRGQFETRMKAIINEARDAGNIILIIDEVHSIVSAGDVEGGAMNAANILKPALARGEVQIIGATTLDEYRKHIEKDSALERRFQPVLVDEPSIDDTIEIIKGIKNYYEDFHKVKISDEVIKYSALMAERYITDRFLPDKAIDVIDEAGSRANLLNDGLVELESLKNELKKVVDSKELAASDEDFEAAADFRQKELMLNDKIAKIEEQCDNVEITKEDIAYVIEAWTKIPVKSISEDESYKLINLEKRLHRKIIAQDDAINKVSKAIRRNRSGFKSKRKPASFIFIGPTGVGKTELTKAIAVELFGSEEAIIRFDMSEFMEKHTVSKLIGAPPGYVGYDKAGQLTEMVRRKPYSVILLDEIEKAHPDVFNLLLQILDDGRLSDNKGRVVNFENTIIIMTSNAGSSNKVASIGFGSDDSENLAKASNDALKDLFRPEFLNRVDSVVVFNRLKKDELREIITLMLNDVIKLAKEKSIILSMDESIHDFILERGYNQNYGARPLRRAITDNIEDELAEGYIRGVYKDGDSLFIKVLDEKIVVEKISEESISDLVIAEENESKDAD